MRIGGAARRRRVAASRSATCSAPSPAHLLLTYGLALHLIGGAARCTWADSSEFPCRPLRLLPPHPALPRHLCSPHLRPSIASLLQECREPSCRCRPADIYAGWDTRQEWAAAPARSDSSGSTVAGCTLHPQTYARAVRHYAHLLQARGQGQGGWHALCGCCLEGGTKSSSSGGSHGSCALAHCQRADQ